VEQIRADRVVLHLVPAPGFTDADQEALREELQTCLGADVTLRLDVAVRIEPERSGKRPVIVTRVRPEDDV
jgi:hypothetical protein